MEQKQQQAAALQIGGRPPEGSAPPPAGQSSASGLAHDGARAGVGKLLDDRPVRGVQLGRQLLYREEPEIEPFLLHRSSPAFLRGDKTGIEERFRFRRDVFDYLGMAGGVGLRQIGR